MGRRWLLPERPDIFYNVRTAKASGCSVTFGYENLTENGRQTRRTDLKRDSKSSQRIFNLELWGLEQENETEHADTGIVFPSSFFAFGARRRVAGTTVSGGSSTTTSPMWM